MKKPICLFLILINLTFVICSSRALARDNLSLANEYFLAPSDQLEVRIIGQKDLDTKQSIAPDGSISLPLLGRIVAQGQTLNSFNNYLSVEFAKYITNPQVIVYLTPRPIYVIQHDIKKNTWDVKKADSIDEARALAGRNYTGDIKHGDIIPVEVSKKPDFFEDNWYKVITATAVLVGIYSTVKK